MSFWEIFVYCLTGAGAMALALAVVGLVGWAIVFCGGFLIAWASDAFENRKPR